MFQGIGNVSFHSTTRAKHIMVAQGLTTGAGTGDHGVGQEVSGDIGVGDIATGFVLLKKQKVGHYISEVHTRTFLLL